MLTVYQEPGQGCPTTVARATPTATSRTRPRRGGVLVDVGQEVGARHEEGVGQGAWGVEHLGRPRSMTKTHDIFVAEWVMKESAHQCKAMKSRSPK